jgi:hypothetical protein
MSLAVSSSISQSADKANRKFVFRPPFLNNLKQPNLNPTLRRHKVSIKLVYFPSLYPTQIRQTFSITRAKKASLKIERSLFIYE